MNWSKKVFWSTPQRKRLTMVGGVIFLFVFVLWEPRIRIHSAGQVEAPTHIVYAPESGFVTHVGYNAQRDLTTDGQAPLLRLLSNDLVLAKYDLESSQNMLRIQQQEASATYERATSRRLLIEQSLVNEKLQALNVQHDSLVITPPKGQWLVEGLPPQSLLGRFFPLGDPIVTLIDKHQRYIEVIVDQRDLYMINVGDQGRIRFAGVAPRIYDATVSMISPVAKLEGAEQTLLVRMTIELPDGVATPPTGLSGDIIILGQPMPLYRHLLHTVRKILRADLWL